MSEKRKASTGEDQEDEFFGDLNDVLLSAVENQERIQVFELAERDRLFTKEHARKLRTFRDVGNDKFGASVFLEGIYPPKHDVVPSFTFFLGAAVSD